MISYLIGKPMVEKESITVLVGGVGYAVRVTEICRQQIATKQTVELYIHTHVREDVLELYGFETANEREIFLLLLGVSGVGPKTALNIINLGVSRIIEAVQQANTHIFAAVPRVGKKLAQKIIIDLRAKLGALKELEIGPLSPQREEVTLALQALGFTEEAVHEVLQTLPIEDIPTSDAVKRAIQLLGKK